MIDPRPGPVSVNSAPASRTEAESISKPVGAWKSTSSQLRSFSAFTSTEPPAPGSMTFAVAPSTWNSSEIASFAVPTIGFPSSPVTSAFLKLLAAKSTVTVPGTHAGVAVNW